MHLADCVGKCLVEGVEVNIILRPLTKEEGRRLFQYRPHSKFAESRWGGDWRLNDKKLVAQGKGTPCRMCEAVTHNEILLNGTCPDCDGRAEAGGKNPYLKVPASECCGGPCRGGRSRSAHRGTNKCCGGKGHHHRK